MNEDVKVEEPVLDVQDESEMNTSWFDRIDKESGSYFSRLKTLRVQNNGGQLNALSHQGSNNIMCLSHKDDRHIMHYWGSAEIDRHAAYFS